MEGSADEKWFDVFEAKNDQASGSEAGEFPWRRKRFCHSDCASCSTIVQTLQELGD
jgi:hypothetical protein